MGAATPPNLGVSRTVLLAGPITARKSAGRKQRTYRPTSLKGEFKRSPANSFTPSEPGVFCRHVPKRHFCSGGLLPPGIRQNCEIPAGIEPRYSIKLV